MIQCSKAQKAAATAAAVITGFITDLGDISREARMGSLTGESVFNYCCLVSGDLLAIVDDFSFSSLLGVALGVELESVGPLIEVLAGSLLEVELLGGVDEDEETGGVIVFDLEASLEVGD